jgi:hypothetical protein
MYIGQLSISLMYELIYSFHKSYIFCNSPSIALMNELIWLY